ncbi:MAG TPA: 50S ribosomal protein L4 [Candidatus Diapherotrites archaeon]|uniref:50S ribosomal protein L4 n=1 Tax=Candidatus Iainarchaeum sp. TaxID=3101447 RepID=A0A7J4J2D9_9ARCH|nr:50S ribosomal protein L4P [uncultured archaeon]HIH10227.1 50S ribosomal protein L4 [Candidatus Diapherotrites archaeon]
MKASVVSLEGRKLSEIELPRQFNADVDETLIRRAVLAIQSASIQTHYPFAFAGRNNTAIYVGSRGKPTMHRTINVGHARKPRMKNRRGLLSGQVAGIPGVVGGPKAHPPKFSKVWEEKINAKEKRKATEAAIAATAKSELVKSRGHEFAANVAFPIVIDSGFENLQKTKDVVAAFDAIGISQDIERAARKKKIRAGKGKKRGRQYKRRKSILIVAADSAKVFKSARNLEGVDIVRLKDLNANVLAPGALPGRLTVWTEKAISEMSGANSKKKETGRK